jgi:hypothetical protein
MLARSAHPGRREPRTPGAGPDGSHIAGDFGVGRERLTDRGAVRHFRAARPPRGMLK